MLIFCANAQDTISLNQKAILRGAQCCDDYNTCKKKLELKDSTVRWKNMQIANLANTLEVERKDKEKDESKLKQVKKTRNKWAITTAILLIIDGIIVVLL